MPFQNDIHQNDGQSISDLSAQIKKEVNKQYSDEDKNDEIAENSGDYSKTSKVYSLFSNQWEKQYAVTDNLRQIFNDSSSQGSKLSRMTG